MLIILKNDRLRDKERKREIESLLGQVEDERFAVLVNLGKKITDWSSEELSRQAARSGQAMDTDDIDENVGVRVMIGDEDEDEEDDERYEVNDEERDDEQDEDELDQDARAHQIISKGKVSSARSNPIQSNPI